MTHASICSGLDGPALAASWLGWENLFHADINPFTNHILKYHYPHAACYTDIRQADFSQWRGKIDVLSAGFPCQPFSVAGKRTGEDHDSYLWPETLRVVDQVRPRWFVGENVNGITSMVFAGEEVAVGSQAHLFGEGREVYERTDRYVIDRICCDLEQIGYEVQPIAIPACAVGAPHERMRVFFLCYDTTHADGLDSDTRQPKPTGQSGAAGITNGGHDTENTVGVRRDGCEPEEEPGQRRQREFGAGGNVRLRGIARATADGSDAGVENVHERQDGVHAVGDAADPAGKRLKYGHATRADRRGEPSIAVGPSYGADCWRNFPTESPVCSRNDGISDRLSRESVFAGNDPARRKDTFNHWRKESIKALGNAIVPQVMYEIYRLIDMIEKQPTP